MDTKRITELLTDFVEPSSLSPLQLEQLSQYLEILQRWNARTNLTAVRDEESIVLRHFGESLFAAQCLFAADTKQSVADLGSGAGLPGIPLKIHSPSVTLTLIESQNKKATFLKEVIRTLSLKDVTVFNGRAEGLTQKNDVVTLRAVEHFETVIGTAETLLSEDPSSRLALLIGETQVARAKELLPLLKWDDPTSIPRSSARVLLVGRR